jgi:hypothetical protein
MGKGDGLRGVRRVVHFIKKKAKSIIRLKPKNYCLFRYLWKKINFYLILQCYFFVKKYASDATPAGLGGTSAGKGGKKVTKSLFLPETRAK